MKKDVRPAPNKERDIDTKDIREYGLMGNNTDALKRLSKFGHKPIKLPIVFHELSAFRINKNEAWKLISVWRDAGYIDFTPYHSVKVKIRQMVI